MTLYATHKYPCLDRYPAGKEYISNSQIKLAAQSQLSGKLGANKHMVANAYTKLKAAFKIASLWDSNSTLHIMFMDGTDHQKQWVKKMVMEKLAPVCHKLTFVWDVPQDKSDVRVSFSLPGQAWSYVGTDCLDIPKTDMTMNLGWIDDDLQYDGEPYKNTGQVVIHEFCHTLGMIHEHQNPKGNPIQWNKPVVYEELQRTNGWDREQVDHNMFEKYGDKDLCQKTKSLPPYDGQQLDIEGYCTGDEVNGSAYDVHSIMHYFYPMTWITAGPKEIPANTELSEMDRVWIGNYYGTPQPDFKKTNAIVLSPEVNNLHTEMKLVIGVCMLSFICIYYSM